MPDTSRNPKTGIRQGLESLFVTPPPKSSNFVHPDNAVTAHPWRADHELFVGEVRFPLGFKEATGGGVSVAQILRVEEPHDTQGIVCNLVGLVMLLSVLLIWYRMEHKAIIKLNDKMLNRFVGC